MASSLTLTPNLALKPERHFFANETPCRKLLNGSPLPSEKSLSSPNKANQALHDMSPAKFHPHLSLLPSQDDICSSFRIQLGCHFLQEVFFACPLGVSQVTRLSTLKTLYVITAQSVFVAC